MVSDAVNTAVRNQNTNPSKRTTPSNSTQSNQNQNNRNTRQRTSRRGPLAVNPSYDPSLKAAMDSLESRFTRWPTIRRIRDCNNIPNDLALKDHLKIKDRHCFKYSLYGRCNTNLCPHTHGDATDPSTVIVPKAIALLNNTTKG